MEKRKNNECQCEHCREIIRQQNRLEKLQKLKIKKVAA